jgi:SAM-dependent methyltransferase
MPVNDDRRDREAAFHDDWASQLDLAKTLVDETFESVTAVENQYILEQFGDLRGLTVLDYGCGAAEGGIYLAKRGAKVVAIDVSAGMLEAAQRLAQYHGVQIETRRVESDRIPAADGEFDRVYGNGVLHHTTLDTAIPELARIMKPSGVGCFIEPLPDNPLINVYRRVASKVRSADETPVSFQQINQFRSSFDHLEHREFWFTTLAVFLKFYLWDRVNPNEERYWKKIYTDAAKLGPMFAPLKKVDDRLLRLIPQLSHLCWTTVITVRNPKRPA